ncbi:hypothetical protein NPX13_g10090 [Xylaria arbuscula]|uniref:CHAT domain-containing protein n=1 Tax=Xylaria arbuscula TaxID=114810 RepID=A0A9W8N568_9PEZI|nr:hypothetical protein NPX13_g10090 [Xylaria arbuscula]
MDDLEQSIHFAQTVVDALPPDHPELFWCLRALGTRLCEKSTITGLATDFEETVGVISQEIDATLQDQERAISLASMATALGAKYTKTGVRDELEQAIGMGRRACELAGTNHPERADIINELGNLLGQRSLISGSPNDLEEAIQLVREAVELAVDNVPTRAVCLNSLGLLLSNRYIATGALVDLDEAISMTRQAVDIPSPNSTMRSVRLSNLGSQLQQRYLRVGEVDDLDESIRLSREALDLLPKHHSNRPIYQHNIGVKLIRKYGSTKKIDYRNDGLQLLRLAIEATAADHPSRPIYLQSLASSLADNLPTGQSMRGAFDDVEELVVVAREGRDALPDDDPLHGDLSYSLGVGYLARCLTVGADNLDEAISCFLSTLHQGNAATLSRIQAGMSLVQIIPAEETFGWNQRYEVASLIMDLVPRLTPRFFDSDDKQNVLAEVAGLASDVAAVALQAEKGVLTALSLIERGLSLLTGTIEEMRTDVSELREKHPELAEQFDSIRNELDTPTSARALSESAPIFKEIRALRRHDAGKGFDELVDRIRELPGFETFVRGPGLKEMLTATDHGFMAIINVSIMHCDAILISPDRLQNIPLDDLSIEDINANVQMGDLGSIRVLEWLWDAIAAPVLNAFGFTQPPLDNDSWPHAWWVPTGLLRQFPLHAAGRHRKSSSQAVLDRVMSSYASSIKAIVYGRRRRRSLNGSCKAVLVAMERTTGHSTLPFAIREVEMISGICPSLGLEPVEPGRRKEDVTIELRDCKIFHFAGHGHTEPGDPLKSYLCLGDGKADPLRVTELIDLNLKQHPPFLAYLSACGTGRIQQERFMDENVHLISAFQLAGFRHVIGTLWEVTDEICVEMAKLVYEGMIQGHMSDDSVCRGLHMASRKHRDDWLDTLGANERMEREATKDASRGSMLGNKRTRDKRMRVRRHVGLAEGG